MNMSSARHKAVLAYVQDLAEKMNLSHFTIEVNQQYETQVRGNIVLAATAVRPDAAGMKIGFSRIFFNVGPKQQRDTVVHELIHGPVDPVFTFGFENEAIRQGFGAQFLELYEATGRMLMERMVDQLASGWSLLLPLPPRFP